jgi:hypothetical protein
MADRRRKLQDAERRVHTPAATADAASAPPLAEGLPARDDPRVAKYFARLAAGEPRWKLEIEIAKSGLNLDADFLDRPDEPL